METHLKQLAADAIASRIWRREPTAFVGSRAGAAIHETIRGRLGWLDTSETMPAELPAIEAFADGLRRDGLTELFLIGIGASSVGARTLRDAAGARTADRAFTVIDTTDEQTIRRISDTLLPDRTCFLVASHHETSHDVVRALERHFWSLVSGVVPSPGRHFAAIAHPATPLVTHACNTGYRHVFINPPDIGERYATLSLFGLVPAVLAGVSGTALLDSARAMADACRPDRPSNPGLVLGAFIGGHAWAGRDKLTVLAAEPLAPLAAWVEQIVAESTGQEGRGVLPIVDEPVGSIGEYGEDRAFVVLLTPEDGELARTASALEAAGLPVFRLVTTPAELGGELFRWQFATAVASAVLGVNPFDEADAVDADGHTNAQLEARRTTGAFRTDPPFDRGPGYRRREFRPAEAAPPRERSYLAVLDYLPRDRRRTAVIRRLRAALRLRSGLATTHGVGPCYLHSTGRYHKGGPNTGAFLILTAADQSATPVPGTKYTFSMLTQAQACGDFDALAAAGRPVIHYHIEDPTGDVASDLERVTRELA